MRDKVICTGPKSSCSSNLKDLYLYVCIDILHLLSIDMHILLNMFIANMFNANFGYADMAEYISDQPQSYNWV